MDWTHNALPVRPEDDAALRKEVESFQRSYARSNQWWARIAIIIAVAEFVMICGLLYALDALIPTVRVVPITMWIRPDGTHETDVMMSGLPKEANEAVRRATLWQYVRLREMYNFFEAQYAWDVISGMSSKEVREVYQRDHIATNKNSPIARLGRKSSIQIEYINSTPLAPDVIRITFWRIVDLDGGKPSRSVWSVAVQFTEAQEVPLMARVHYNPAGIIVTGYSGAEQESPEERVQ
jgi:type IV secretion system protein VirB8